jgi:hypothetical protein
LAKVTILKLINALMLNLKLSKEIVEAANGNWWIIEGGNIV